MIGGVGIVESNDPAEFSSVRTETVANSEYSCLELCESQVPHPVNSVAAEEGNRAVSPNQFVNLPAPQGSRGPRSKLHPSPLPSVVHDRHQFAPKGTAEPSLGVGVIRYRRADLVEH